MSQIGVNPVDFLYKMATSQKIQAPVFQEIGMQGPPHMRSFLISCTFNEVTAQGEGRSKKEAKVAAAKNVASSLDMTAVPQRTFQDALLERKKKQEEMAAAGVEPKAKRKKLDKQAKKAQQMAQQQQMMMMGMFPPDPDYVGNRPPVLPPGGFGAYDPSFANPAGPIGGFGPMGPGPNMGMGMPPGGPNGQNFSVFGGARGMGCPRLNLRMTRADLHVVRRHSAIYPTKFELGSIMKLVEKTENGLQEIAKELNKNDSDENKAFKNNLNGVARVGEVAKGLLIRGDRSANLILLCTKAPTHGQLSKVHEKFLAHMEKNQDREGQYVSSLFPEEAGFSIGSSFTKEAKPEVKTEVKSEPTESSEVTNGSEVKPESEEPETIECVVYVTLTSTKLGEDLAWEEMKEEMEKEKAEKEKEKAKEGEEKKEEEEEKTEEKELPKREVEEEDASDPWLPKERCLMALTELNHSSWFAWRPASLPSCVEVIRILRDLTRRDLEWAPLSDWAVEVIAEKALSTSVRPLGPSSALSRVMECLGSGLLLPCGPGIADPCERKTVDLTLNLTPQQLEDVTSCAQKFVRYISFKKIHLVLGMEPLPFKEYPKKQDKDTSKNGDDGKASQGEVKQEETSTTQP